MTDETAVNKYINREDNIIIAFLAIVITGLTLLAMSFYSSY